MIEALTEGKMGKGKTAIPFQLDKLQRQQKELERACTEAERNGKVPEEIRTEIEEAINGIQFLETEAVNTLDSQEKQEHLHQVEAQQRPQTSFPIFGGQPTSRKPSRILLNRYSLYTTRRNSE